MWLPIWLPFWYRPLLPNPTCVDSKSATWPRGPAGMGKRKRRRRRERLITPPQPVTPGQRPASAPTGVRPTVQPVAAQLQHLVEQRRTTEIAVDEEIARLLAAGVGWPMIAAALDVSRQAARQRWLRRQL
jgi:hypothetical protein